VNNCFDLISKDLDRYCNIIVAPPTHNFLDEEAQHNFTINKVLCPYQI
jgi:hypothetical protein